MPKLEPYSRKLPYSYALGLFPCMKLMEAHPEAVRRLLLHPDAAEASLSFPLPEGRASGEVSGVEKLRALCRQHGIREEIAEKVLKRESKKDNCFAGLVFEKYVCTLRKSANHAVLCQISDSGNLGTALRSLLGFGLEDVALIRPCVDPYEPHTLRASMGAFYDLRLRVYETFDQYLEEFPGRSIYPFMLDGAKPLDQVARNARAPYTLVFGNEQRGLPATFQQYGQSVLIPQSNKIDSLNLAVAVSIGAYAFTTGGK
ncbi:MAG TPA: TrmH family RNA methyltransferase [Candidatus Pullichristensenella excrementigallinarum]|uniref:TrmH family RNA methyltransferase n=1 Tax=Candidatus Pullichristensenella excrementigallinarum TaxID=2840907 RepID=A0A9D1I9W9_9FIRM|nr:TrmH family RNA methyltransferase [Candidatus Pullichristensenella excrementigallinarum]